MMVVGLAVLGVPQVVSALTFSPPRLFVQVSPGEEKVVSFDIENETAREANASVQVRAFTSSHEAGRPAFSDEPLLTSIEPFVVLSANEVRFAPAERKSYSFTVRVPKTTTPGSYYGAIHLAFAALDGGAGTQAVTGPLVFLTVLGEAKSAIAIASASTVGGHQDALPASYSVILRNDGQFVEIPKGELQVRNLFGTVVRAYSVNLSEAALLPGESRTFAMADTESNAGLRGELTRFGFGPYAASLAVRGSSAPQVTMEVGRVWVWPWRLVSLAAAASLMIAMCLSFLFPKQPKGAV